MFSWNYFLFALVLSNGDTKTLIAASFNFIGEGVDQLGRADGRGHADRAAAAGARLLVQRRLVSGLALGAVKG